jgi:aspartate racemase
MTRPLHIGIVGCSAEGAALCYRTICAEGAALLGPRAHPEVSLHTASFADYVRCLDAKDIQGVADLMLSSAHKLAAAGADFLICPDNTIHQAFPLVAPASPLPWLRRIMDELVNGVFRSETVAFFQQVIGGLQARGCDAVILGCTEIPLIIDDRNSPLPTLDSTRLLARAALRRVVEASTSGRPPAWRSGCAS